MSKWFRLALVPLLLIALAGCETTGKTCCGSCGKAAAAQKSCEKADKPCAAKKDTASCEKAKAEASCEKAKAEGEKK